MVTIKAVHQRLGTEGKPYLSLELTGSIELVPSKNTGRFYATARRCFVYSTLDLETAKAAIGTMMPGTITKVVSEPYEYTVPETGEVITVTHRYVYQPEANIANADTSPAQLLKAV